MAYDSLEMLDDVGRPFTAKAAGTITAGDLVGWASGTNCVGSRVPTYAWNDIAVVKASGTAGEHVENTLGIALTTAASGADVSVATDGIYILPCGSNGASGGLPVVFVGYSNCVEKISTGSVALTEYGIGRALTTGTSEAAFVAVRLRV